MFIKCQLIWVIFPFLHLYRQFAICYPFLVSLFLNSIVDFQIDVGLSMSYWPIKYISLWDPYFQVQITTSGQEIWSQDLLWLSRSISRSTKIKSTCKCNVSMNSVACNQIVVKWAKPLSHWTVILYCIIPYSEPLFVMLSIGTRTWYRAWTN